MKTHVKALAPVSHLVVILVRHKGMPHRGMDIVLNSPISAGQSQAASASHKDSKLSSFSREDFLDLSV